MMKKMSLFGLLAIGYWLLAKSVLAVSPVPSPTLTLSPTPTTSIGNNVEEKVKEIRDAVKEKVRQKIEEVKLGQKRAYFGDVKEINDTTLVLSTSGGDKSIIVAEDAAIVGKGGKKITLQDIVVGNFCIAIGYVGENDILDGRRIIIVTKPKPVNREVVFGIVTDTSDEEKVLTVKNEKKNIVYTVEVTDKTIITRKAEGNVEKAKFADVQKGDRLVAIGASSENEEKFITAKIIHIIPGKAIGQEESEITPSPTPKPTKAKTTPTASPTPQEEF